MAAMLLAFTPMQAATDIIDRALEERPAGLRARLEKLRRLIHAVAGTIPEIRSIEECLKWGQPSFVARPKGIGSTVRIDGSGDGVSIFFICTTGLVERFREIYPDSFTYVGNREIRFGPDDDLNEDALSHCIAMALTYHLGRKRRASGR